MRPVKWAWPRVAASSGRLGVRSEPFTDSTQPRPAALASAAEAALREAQTALAPFPAVSNAGFLGDAEREYAEARLTAALVAGGPLPTAVDLGVAPTSWMKGLAEAASELRRHLLDRLRAGDLDRGEDLLEVMDDVYDALVARRLPRRHHRWPAPYARRATSRARTHPRRRDDDRAADAAARVDRPKPSRTLTTDSATPGRLTTLDVVERPGVAPRREGYPRLSTPGV